MDDRFARALLHWIGRKDGAVADWRRPVAFFVLRRCGHNFVSRHVSNHHHHECCDEGDDCVRDDDGEAGGVVCGKCHPAVNNCCERRLHTGRSGPLGHGLGGALLSGLGGEGWSVARGWWALVLPLPGDVCQDDVHLSRAGTRDVGRASIDHRGPDDDDCAEYYHSNNAPTYYSCRNIHDRCCGDDQGRGVHRGGCRPLGLGPLHHVL
mmetsp:Transcript_36499/g.97199  ORF Transcript_36499/g.97199 Transcript_36499/m.97199 type:complete len:208 (+) Transcript_36499:357-980(+)